MSADPPANSPVEDPPSLRPSGSRHLLCLVFVVALVLLDLWSKAAVFGWFQDPELAAELGRSERGHLRHPVMGEWLGFMLNLNYGAAFGKGGGMPWLLIGGRCIAGVVLSVMIWRTPRGQGAYLAALVLILAGALGNLYDNFFYDPPAGTPGIQADRPFGPVRDFIDVYFYGWDWHFPTFNVADSCITVGAILLILSGLLPGPRRVGPDGDGASSGAPAA